MTWSTCVFPSLSTRFARPPLQRLDLVAVRRLVFTQFRQQRAYDATMLLGEVQVNKHGEGEGAPFVARACSAEDNRACNSATSRCSTALSSLLFLACANSDTFCCIDSPICLTSFSDSALSLTANASSSATRFEDASLSILGQY